MPPLREIWLYKVATSSSGASHPLRSQTRSLPAFSSAPTPPKTTSGIMKVIIIIAAVLVAVCALPRPQQAAAPAVGQSVVYPIRPYSYAYEVSDPPSGNFQNKAEIKNANGDVFGSWSVLMPDNYIYTTNYNVTGLNGFQYSILKTLATAAQGALAGAAAAPATTA